MVEAFRVLLNERQVEDGARLPGFPHEQVLHDAFEQGNVAVDFDGKKQSGDWCALTQPVRDFLRMNEPGGAGFG